MAGLRRQSQPENDPMTPIRWTFVFVAAFVTYVASGIVLVGG